MPPSGHLPPRVLVIAGSDSGGGAGIQADIKTITMLGGFAMTAITAVTAQNTQGVHGIHPIPTAMIRQQIACVMEDIGADIIKIGMLGTADITHAVADAMDEYSADTPLVLDPVMQAKAARHIAALGAKAVLVKGGHLYDASSPHIITNLLYAENHCTLFKTPRIDSPHTHGTGCTLASAIATGLAQGMNLPAAITRAEAYVHGAIHNAPAYGQGHGPMHHGWTLLC